jgi:ribosomal protein S18 acetylase RimI-like enzyme
MPETFTITHYARANFQAVLDLIYSQYHVHTNFDWYTAERWLDHQQMPVLLAWYNDKLQGVIGASDPLNGTSWLRLLAVRDVMDVDTLLRVLRTPMREMLKTHNVQTLWILAASEWLSLYMGLFGAELVEKIITLRHDEQSLPLQRNLEVSVRPAEWEDLAAMTAIDQRAFAPPWQLTQGDLRQAMRLAASCTIAMLDGAMVGYQLSTRHRDSGHLARLAVDPSLHGGGVGGALVHRLLIHFYDRSVHTVTVNTQETNLRSQRLYQYYGFLRNGYDLPVWRAQID